MNGIVTSWNVDRGWGFAATGDLEVFVHHAAVAGDVDLHVGQIIELDVGIGTHGPVALNVLPHDDHPPADAPLESGRAGRHPDVHVAAANGRTSVRRSAPPVALHPHVPV